ncbi:MAG: rhomboid family intramembrane serine protease [Armatimonadota bacterium]
MTNCPNCGQLLAEERGAHGVQWRCPGCGGRLTAIAVLRKLLPADAINEVWQAVWQGEGARGRPCPSCGNFLTEVRSTAGGSPLRLDVCRPCQLVWFDPQEFEALPRLPPKPKEPELPPEVREAVALAEIQAIRERYDRMPEAQAPESPLQATLGVLGLPVEVDEPETEGYPWATWLLVAVVTLVSLYVMFYEPWAIEAFGMVPAQPFRFSGLTFISVFFLHGGLYHLLGNMYFLFIFGNNVEHYLGRQRFLLLLLAATVVGNIAHILGSPGDTTPCIGASGGIAGVMICYALAYPKARFALLLRQWVYFQWIRVPAYGMILFWVGLQLYGVWQQLAGFSNVSALAHLGGAATGLFCWLLWRRPPEPHRVVPSKPTVDKPEWGDGAGG